MVSWERTFAPVISNRLRGCNVAGHHFLVRPTAKNSLTSKLQARAKRNGDFVHQMLVGGILPNHCNVLCSAFLMARKQYVKIFDGARTLFYEMGKNSDLPFLIHS